MIRRIVTLLALLAGAGGVAAVVARAPTARDGFDHPKHAKLFVSCATCHVGTSDSRASIFPTPAQCATCHDGQAQRLVTWQPRVGPPVTHLSFDHVRHLERRHRVGADSTGTCSDCHAQGGAAWMDVRGPDAPQCLSCHKLARENHFSLPDSTCKTCHLALSEAKGLTRERVARFPQPVSHTAANFQSAEGHGKQAKAVAAGDKVAFSCATCHVRPYCTYCHVNAPEVKEIQALGFYGPAVAVPHKFNAPANHAAADFESRHGALAGHGATTCRTCHTQESCAACHVAQLPSAARGLYPAGEGRGQGAVTVGKHPSTHTPTWKTSHGPVATASMTSCTSCHVRESCLACHVPNASQKGGYHPTSYLTRHPADAYTRASSCTECHNQGQFCQSCHQQAGVVSQRALLGNGGYHDGNRQFFVGHGTAARQSLESCASCHVERDCLTCHSAQKGRGFSPHGPSFDAERVLRKNPQLCIACHGTAIPRRR
jgi:hypothetical protein